MKKKFCLYTDLLVKVGNLSNEELGELFRAILVYVNGGGGSISSPSVGVAFGFVKIDLDFFQECYEKKCKANRENGQLGGRPRTQENPKKPNGFSDNPNKAKKPDIDIDTDRISISKTYTVNSFEEFWKAYPKKVAKQSALKVWEKLKPDEELTATILSAIEKQKRSATWKKDNGQYIPHPATWLNGKRWEDEISTKNRGYRVNDIDTEEILKGLSYEL